MMYTSSRWIYLSTKYGPLVMAIAPHVVTIFIAIDAGLDPGLLFVAPVTLTFSILFYLMFRYWSRVLVEIELSYLSIEIPSRGTTIQWTDVREINFTIWGLYKLTTDEFVIYFAPFDLSLNAFGFKVTTDEFDEIIEKRKRELKI